MYIIEVESREFNIYVVKFYLKSHRDSDKRYFLTLDKHQRDSELKDTGAKNCFLILNTILKISGVILKKDSKASFGFVGAPKISEIDNSVNTDGTYKNTTRFRVYKSYVLRYFSPEKFKHIEFLNSSSYILKNKHNNMLTKDVVEKLLISYINN